MPGDVLLLKGCRIERISFFKAFARGAKKIAARAGTKAEVCRKMIAPKKGKRKNNEAAFSIILM